MKKVFRIVCLVLALALMFTVIANAAVINYEIAVEQALAAANNATTANDRVFYLITAIYDYCYTDDPSRAVPLLAVIKEAVESDAEGHDANAKLAADMTDSACKLLLKKQEYKTAKAMGEESLAYYNSINADAETVANCEAQIKKCNQGMLVDKLMLIFVPVFVLIVVIVFAVVSKRTKNKGAGKVVHKK